MNRWMMGLRLNFCEKKERARWYRVRKVAMVGIVATSNHKCDSTPC